MIEQGQTESAILKLGVLGSPTGWYVRDLQRAASAMPAHRTTTVHALSFSKLSVWSLQQKSLKSRHFDRLGMEHPNPVPIEDYNALLVRSMPLGSLEQIVFRMNALHVAIAQGLSVLNPPRCLEIAIDKWLTLDVAAQHGIETPRTVCCQSREDAMAAFEALGGDCIIKPIFGGEGRGIVRVADQDIAWRVFSTLEQLQSVIYVQEFLVNHGHDLRLLVVGDELFCVRRENNGDWRSNISRGGQAYAHEPSFEQTSMAFKIAKAIQGWMVGVDILPTRDGRNVLLEVNAVPGWKATAAALHVDMASVMLHRIHEMREFRV